MRARSLICTCVLSGCYSPAVVDTVTETAGTNDATMGTLESTVGSTEPTGDPSTDPSMTSTPTTTVDPESTSAGTELGPRIVMSIPADGDVHAPLSGAFAITFDRVVGIDDAVGHISVTQDGGEPMPISPMPCPPDADPTCVFGYFPAEFLDEDTGQLPPGTAHTLIVDADFPDPDGNVNTIDQVVSFTTFTYEPNFFDDSDAFSNEFGGLAYDDVQGALYLVGEQSGGGACLARRVPLVDGAPQAAATAATPTGAYLCYGTDIFGQRLWVSGTYTDNVFRYDLGPGDLMPTELVIASPMLPPPLDDLEEVWSVAPNATNAGVLFAHGEFTGGVEDISILQRTDAGVWSEWHSGAGLWDNANGVVIASGYVGGEEHVFVIADGQIFDFLPDATLVSQAELGFLGYDDDLHVDAQGRVWVGTYGGVYALDPTDGFATLAERGGFSASRIALREDGNTVHVYFARFRDIAVIGHVAIEF